MEEAVDCDGDDEADDGEAHDDVVEPGVLVLTLEYNINISLRELFIFGFWRNAGSHKQVTILI